MPTAQLYELCSIAPGDLRYLVLVYSITGETLIHVWFACIDQSERRGIFRQTLTRDYYERGLLVMQSGRCGLKAEFRDAKIHTHLYANT